MYYGCDHHFLWDNQGPALKIVPRGVWPFFICFEYNRKLTLASQTLIGYTI